VTAETIPFFLGDLCELEDHGEGGCVREISLHDRRRVRGAAAWFTTATEEAQPIQLIHEPL
jgi:hypothetical protein